VIDVSEVMNDEEMGAQPITIRRPTTTTDATGLTTATYVDQRATALVQPATPFEIQILPEGSREGNIISVWTTTPIRISDAKSIESDIVIVCGNSYRCIKLDPRPAAGYFRAFAEGFVP
jgi:hypothetical protein